MLALDLMEDGIRNEMESNAERAGARRFGSEGWTARGAWSSTGAVAVYHLLFATAF